MKALTGIIAAAVLAVSAPLALRCMASTNMSILLRCARRPRPWHCSSPTGAEWSRAELSGITTTRNDLAGHCARVTAWRIHLVHSSAALTEADPCPIRRRTA